MNNYYSGKLELVSLVFSEKSEDDYICGISLTKGIHQFGKIKFYLQKGSQSFQFQEPNIIDFFFPPTMKNRKDILFHINFEDMETGDYFGNIDISTNRLSDLFSSDKNAVIDEEQQFFEGASLRYKIYLPKILIYKKQEKYSLNLDNKKNQGSTTQIDAIISSLFSRPDPNLKPRRQRVQKKASMEIEKSNKEKAPQKDILSIFDFLVRKKVSEDQPQEKTNQNLQVSQTASNLMVSTINFMKDESSKKHTLMPVVGKDHHQTSKLSIKLKTVILMLIFGIFALIFQFYQDSSIKLQAPEKVINHNNDETKKIKKGKKKKH